MMERYRWAEPLDGRVRLHDEPFPASKLTRETVVVRPSYAGICRADVKELAGARDKLPYQHSLFGHEVAGIVAHAGEPTGFAEGELVTLNPNAGSERTTAFADAMLVSGSRETLGRALIRLPGNLPLDPPWLVEPLACVIHAADRIGEAFRGARAGVIGAGNAGLLFAFYGAHLGAQVTLLNRSEARRKFVQQFGAETLPLHEAQEDQFDVVVLATTVITGDVLDNGMRLARPGGYILLYGGTRAGFARYGHDLNEVRREGLLVRANTKPVMISGGYGCSSEDFSKAIALYSGHRERFPLERLVTGTIRLDELPDTMERMAAGEYDPPGKIVVRIGR